MKTIKVGKIIYKYRRASYGVRLKSVVCPVCKNPINWTKPINSYDYNDQVVLLAECWSGNTEKEKPQHLFLINIDNLPIVEIKKAKRSE
jgi:hypothetical protein